MQHVNWAQYGYLLYNHILNLDWPSKKKSVSSSTSESLFLQGMGRLRSHNGIYVGKYESNVVAQQIAALNKKKTHLGESRHKHLFHTQY